MVWYFIGVYIIKKTLHGRLEIQNFSSHVEKIFQHSTRNFVSPRSHVISSILKINILYNNLYSDSSPDHLQSSTSPLPLSHCSCSAGCSTRRCPCVRENIKCQNCRCGAPCKNPLNILAEFGVDLDKATSDFCLMQKLPKVCSMSGPLYQTCDCLLITTCLTLKFLHHWCFCWNMHYLFYGAIKFQE